MRPVRLEMEGFATFRNRTALDFDGLDLVAFTGPTGAGKSTVIDAVTFALYGSVARYDNPKLVAPVIHQLANEAKVRLDFEVGGARYTAVRVVRRTKSGASTREARLERIEAGAEGPAGETVTTLAGSVSELDAAVVELLGLDFNQFTRTIVLPQGDFAQFLRDEPANRQKLLRRLLDLEVFSRMGALAREQAKTAAVQLEAVRPERDRLAPVDPAELAVAVDRRDRIATLRAGLGDRLAALAATEQNLVPLRERCTVIDGRRERLGAVAVPDDAGEIAAAIDTAATDRAAALTEALSGLKRTATEAESERDAAESERRRLRSAADAASWTATLVVGENCPVCHRPVDEVPDHDADAELARAEAAVTAATTAARDADRNLSRAEADSASVAGECRKLGERLDRLDEAIDQALDGPDATADLDELQARMEAITRAEKDRSEADRSVREAEAALTVADRAVTAAEARAADLTATLARTRDGLAELGPPALDGGSLAADWHRLAGWAADTDRALGTERSELAAEGKRLAKEKEALDAAIREEGAAVGIDVASTEMATALATAEVEVAATIVALEQRAADRERLSGQVDELEETRQVNAALGLHLKADRFEGWLLDEALERIVERSTDWLLDLSRGQYSLAVSDRQFAIIDHANADDRRDVRTLSGGETFLASLALALALADSVAELAPVDAPRLESMFLDEGFGTLDPETLDVVAAAIEELAASGRMIGIVTHVADLAERMPARFEIRKSAEGSAATLVN